MLARDFLRPFFRFAPVVAEEKDEYKAPLAGAKLLAANGAIVRGIPVTEELYDLILFCVYSFVRAITTELYAFRHSDNILADEPKCLLVTVRNVKTRMRVANTMARAIAPYKRLCERYPGLPTRSDTSGKF